MTQQRPVATSMIGARSSGGFTLVELTVVLILVGIVVSIAMPSIRVSRFQMETAVRAIGTSMTAAQTLAVLRQHDIVLSFDTLEGRMRVHLDENNNGSTDDTESVRIVQLDDGVAFGRGSATALPQGSEVIAFSDLQDGFPSVTFHRNGSSSEEGVVYLTSRRARLHGGFPEDARALVVERATGRIECLSHRELSWSASC